MRMPRINASSETLLNIYGTYVGVRGALVEHDRAQGAEVAQRRPGGRRRG